MSKECHCAAALPDGSRCTSHQAVVDGDQPDGWYYVSIGTKGPSDPAIAVGGAPMVSFRETAKVFMCPQHDAYFRVHPDLVPVGHVVCY